MSVGAFVLKGFGPTTTAPIFVMKGFGTQGAARAVVATTQETGVKHRRPPVIRLSDLKPGDRQSTADFLKTQLGLDEKYAEARQQQPAKVGRKSKAQREAERVAELAMRNAAIEAENETRTVRNNNMLILLMMANG